MNASKKCAKCEKTVYPIEEVKCLEKVWHKACFKCQTCNMTLSMKNYKGFGKLPYCNAHIPKAKATIVADTPEMKRLAENSKNQSNVKYHAEFEASKGKFTAIADDPEIQRIKANTQTISNISYHGIVEQKAAQERMRNLNEENCAPSSRENVQNNVNTKSSYAPEPAKSVPLQPKAPSNQGGGAVLPPPTAAVTLAASKKKTVERNVVGKSVGSSSSSSSIYDKSLGPTHQYLNSQYQQQQVSYESNHERPNHHAQQQQQQAYYGIHAAENVSQHHRNSHHHHQQQQQPQQQHARQSTTATANHMKQKSNKCYQALYDYDAQDEDEVSFVDGDLIINCNLVDEGWMIGTVHRTGRSGMLPANYVQRVNL